MTSICSIDKVEFEDTKEVIRICKSKKNKQHNDQKEKYKRTNNDLQNTHKTKDRFQFQFILCISFGARLLSNILST
jgi:hypothetical protein